MGGLGHTHEMRGDLRIEVRGDLHTRRGRDRGAAQPAADAADPHQVRHHVVAGARRDRLVHVARPVEILAELHGRIELAGELRVARNVVVGDRLLEPVQALVVERVAAVQRVAERQTLVEVDHQLTVFARSLADLADRCEVVAEPVAAEPELESPEAAFGDQLCGFACERRHVDQPQAVAVVGRHRAHGSAEQDRKRHPRGFGQCVPHRHVQAGHSDHGNALVADEIETAAVALEIVQRRERFARLRRRKIVDHRNDRARRILQIRLEIAAPDHALVGLKVDQDQRPVLEQADLGDDGPPQRHADRANLDRFEGELLEHGPLRFDAELMRRQSRRNVNSLIGILDGNRMRRSRDETHRRILDAAYGLFWRQGFLRVSMDEIAARAGITKRAMYQHFRSKDDLIAGADRRIRS